MSVSDIIVRVDSSEAREDLAELEAKAAMTFNKILSGARKTATVIIGVAQASGAAFDQVLATGIEIALLTAELLTTIAVAESLTLVGALQAGVKVALIIALIARANALRSERLEVATKISGVITALSVLTY